MHRSIRECGSCRSHPRAQHDGSEGSRVSVEVEEVPAIEQTAPEETAAPDPNSTVQRAEEIINRAEEKIEAKKKQKAAEKKEAAPADPSAALFK